MTTQALLSASVICMGRTQRARLMRQMVASHATEFRQGMHGQAAANAEESLEKGQLRLLPASALGVLCLAGELWLTRDGDAEDYILGPGQQLALGRNDQAAVQALQASRFSLILA